MASAAARTRRYGRSGTADLSAQRRRARPLQDPSQVAVTTSRQNQREGAISLRLAHTNARGHKCVVAFFTPAMIVSKAASGFGRNTPLTCTPLTGTTRIYSARTLWKITTRLRAISAYRDRR